ncbi:unnamed protein product [Knipowitschia caucasica]|uniref:Uncharacterized protein n=1 Tax=Knipowitschia caucasica TaxID=637954 RepID=A0AAV2JAY2_KNICA
MELYEEDMDEKEEEEEDIKPLDFQTLDRLNTELFKCFNLADEVAKEIQESTNAKRKQRQRKSLFQAIQQQERKHRDIDFRVEKAKLELTRDHLKSKYQRDDRLLYTEEIQMFSLQKVLDAENRCYDNYLSINKSRAEKASLGTEEARDAESELDGLNEALAEGKKEVEKDLERIDGVQRQYSHCKDVILKISQEAHKAKLEYGKKIKSFGEDNVVSTVTEVLDVMTEVTEQNLSLIQNTPKLDDTLKDLSQCILSTSAQTEEVEEKVSLQILDLTSRVEAQRMSTVKLEQKVKLYEAIETDAQDLVLNALGEMTSRAYARYDRRQLSALSSLEKLTNIERRVCSVLEQLEAVPEDFVEAMIKMKESERRLSQLEEKRRLERLKQKERQQKCMQRTFKQAPGKGGRRLMPRHIPVSRTKEEEKKTEPEEEDDIQVFLWGPRNAQ